MNYAYVSCIEQYGRRNIFSNLWQITNKCIQIQKVIYYLLSKREMFELMFSVLPVLATLLYNFVIRYVLSYQLTYSEHRKFKIIMKLLKILWKI